MLMAPIFHSNYRSPKISTTQDKINDKSSSSPSCVSTSSKISDSNASLSKYNIFKSALNKGINFLSKITSSSGSPSSGSSTGSKSTSDRNSSSNNSNDNQTPASDCSSPDSLKTEMIFFKPICREPRTPSSIKPTIIRVPSMRSNASSTTTTDIPISSPCPSPFFIPITPKRRSAFSFVGIDECDEEEDEEKDNKMKEVKKSSVKSQRKTTSVKRKIIQISPEKTKPLPKKVKVEPKTSVVRKTRSMDKKSDLPNKNEPIEVKKSHRRSVEVETQPVRSTRVLRSQSFKH